MDGATLQAKVYAGYAKAAQRIGVPFDQYRASSATNPLDIWNKIATLSAAFTVHGPSNFDFTKPSDHKQPLYHALFDAAQAQVGDYFVSAAHGTFFLASLPLSTPPLAVNCNRTVTVSRPGPATRAVGGSGYSGTSLSTDVAQMTGWPASVLLGARGIRDQQLPSDAGYGSWRILMPQWPGIAIRPGWIITDELSNRYIVLTAELQDLGWRIDATQAVT